MDIRGVIDELETELTKLYGRRGDTGVKEKDLLLKKARRYLQSARMLLQEGDHESSVSRTYYAMFYSVQALLLIKNLSFTSHKREV
ncbi:MAG: HEPN domain-containing protein [Anaerolineae bacterium]